MSFCLQRDISALCPSVQFLWGPAWKRRKCTTVLLRVIRHFAFQDITAKVEVLYWLLRTNLGLRARFILLFEDPDFNNQLCTLTDIKGLPLERATIKVIFTSDDTSDSTLDTCSLLSVSSIQSVILLNALISCGTAIKRSKLQIY
ncbi:hypothetical protein AMECASPLE_035290 [Ameca splendens]|uniref:Uncharacterized protein n=1 Tax=Ameca splendens TaxID=208324 RepID=A0ABV0ZSK5_9TELE